MNKSLWNTLVTVNLFRAQKSKCLKCAGTKMCLKHKKLKKLIGTLLKDVDPKLLK